MEERRYLIHFWYRNELILIETKALSDFEDRIILDKENVLTIKTEGKDPFADFKTLTIFKSNIFCIERLR